MKNNIDSALSWLSEREVCSGPFGLHRMEFLMDRLRNPHRDVPSILVGGTNGKGSVTAIIEAILAASPNYEVGSTISPHLVSPKERIRLQQKCLPDRFWIDGVEALRDHVRLMEKESSIGVPSFFELVTALAFWSFRESDRDIAILEVGLGGRLDATNIAHPEVSVITNIGTDHKEILGPDRPAIAREKLGIVRRKRTLFTSEGDPEILSIFEREAEKQKAALHVIKGNDAFEILETHAKGHTIKLKEGGDPVPFILPGRHQLSNLSLALGVIFQLRKNGFDIPNEAICSGIPKVTWPGRLHWVEVNPPVLLDGAHNMEGLKSLLDYLKEFPMPRPCHLILGALKKKPFEAMAQALSCFADTLSFVPPSTPRSIQKDEFISRVQNLDKRWVWHDTVESALEAGKNSGSILLTGSLYLVADFFKSQGTAFP